MHGLPRRSSPRSSSRRSRPRANLASAVPSDAFGTAIHRRCVDESCSACECGLDDVARERRVLVERVPASEPDDRAEPPFSITRSFCGHAQPPDDRRRMRPRSGRRPHRGRGPCARAADRHRRRASVVRSAAAATSDISECRARARPSCDATTPRWRSRSSAAETRAASIGVRRGPTRRWRPPRARRRRARTACRCRRCPARRRTPRRHGPRRPRAQRGGDRHAPHVTAETRRDRHCRARSDRARATCAPCRTATAAARRPQPDVRDPEAASAAHTGATCECTRAEDDRQSGEHLGEVARPLQRVGSPTARVCTAAPSRVRPPPAPSSRPRVRFA